MKENTINYIEIGTTDITKVKNFYSTVFWWEFTDYGENYTAFKNSWVKWGFELVKEVHQLGVLIVLFSDDLVAKKEEIIKAWWKITVDIFSFPWGERFEFSDPVWNVLAVWTEKE